MKFNRYLDHTLLRADATSSDIEQFCREAYDYDFHCAVVAPVFVSLAAGLLEGCTVRTCTVVSFPLGTSQTEIKIAEAIRAEADGAREIDIVANLGLIQSGQFSLVTRELLDVRRRLSPDTILKVIIETPLIKPELWNDAAEAVIRSGAEFVKTATGFFGATTRRHVEQLREYCGDRIKIKAAGGIRTAADATDCYVVVANWPEQRARAWRTLLAARAMDCQAYVLGVNRVGDADGNGHRGDTTLLDPMGEVIDTLVGRPGVVVGDVDPERVAECRRRYPFLADRRPEVYRPS